MREVWDPLFAKSVPEKGGGLGPRVSLPPQALREPFLVLLMSFKLLAYFNITTVQRGAIVNCL